MLGRFEVGYLLYLFCLLLLCCFSWAVWEEIAGFLIISQIVFVLVEKLIWFTYFFQLIFSAIFMVLNTFIQSSLKEFKLVVEGSLFNLRWAALQADCSPTVRVYCVCFLLFDSRIETWIFAEICIFIVGENLTIPVRPHDTSTSSKHFTSWPVIN